MLNSNNSCQTTVFAGVRAKHKSTENSSIVCGAGNSLRHDPRRKTEKKTQILPGFLLPSFPCCVVYVCSWDLLLSLPSHKLPRFLFCLSRKQHALVLARLLFKCSTWDLAALAPGKTSTQKVQTSEDVSVPVIPRFCSDWWL